MNVLVINTGSSTVKFALIESKGEVVLLEGLADWAVPPARLEVKRPPAEAIRETVPAGSPRQAVEQVLRRLTEGTPALLAACGAVAAVGHRVVHGGDQYTASVRITPVVLGRLAELAELAPLHNPVNLEGIEAAQAAWPGVPQVAVFDTAFHATLPPEARTYAIPYAWTEQGKLRRYGFHGLSHAYCAGRAAQLLGRSPQGLRLVLCHLGNGASLAAVRDGVCVDTSMGFTPLAGLVMGTRSGDVDPGLLLHVLRRQGLSADQLDHVLNYESGLLGISGVSGDMRQVQGAAQAGQARAQLALAVYLHRLRQGIAAMTASLGGLDALVFTAGVGEHSAYIRQAACQGLEFLGLTLDPQANAQARPDTDVADPTSRVRILVIATREDLTIARETVRVLHGHAPDAG
jgi:acetate kinase